MTRTGTLPAVPLRWPSGTSKTPTTPPSGLPPRNAHRGIHVRTPRPPRAGHPLPRQPVGPPHRTSEKLRRASAWQISQFVLMSPENSSPLTKGRWRTFIHKCSPTRRIFGFHGREVRVIMRLRTGVILHHPPMECTGVLESKGTDDDSAPTSIKLRPRNAWGTPNVVRPPKHPTVWCSGITVHLGR